MARHWSIKGTVGSCQAGAVNDPVDVQTVQEMLTIVSRTLNAATNRNPVDRVVKLINPVLRGWVNYHFRGHFCVHCRYGPVTRRQIAIGSARSADLTALLRNASHALRLWKYEEQKRLRAANGEWPVHRLKA